MAKPRPREEQEIPFVALMDTMTNVVGVLIIVLVLVGLSVASAVKKILSDLPPVDEKTLVELKQVIALKTPLQDPAKIDEKATELEKQLKKAIEDLKTLDLTQDNKDIVKIDDLDKQIEAQKKARDANKAAIEKLIAEMDAMKARLDQTPKYQPPPPSIVRLPNPRPYPEKPKETRILVAKQGVLIYNETEYMKPILDGLDQVRSQLEYKEVKYEPFMAMLEKILGSKAEAQKAWPELAPLAGVYQMELVAKAYKNLVAGGVQPSKAMLQGLGNISLVLRQTLPDVASAVVAATKGDYSKWVAMDPARAPAPPIIKVVPAGNKVTFYYGAAPEEVRATPRDVLGYFKTLADKDAFKAASKNVVIYDAFRVVEVLKKAASSQIITKAFTMTPSIRPGAIYTQLALTPRSGGGESADQMKQPNSGLVRALRNIKEDPDGVALFQIMPDAIPTYLDARTIADEVGVPATWEFLRDLNINVNVTGYVVQRFTETPQARPVVPGTVPAAVIAPPKKTLD